MALGKYVCVVVCALLAGGCIIISRHSSTAPPQSIYVPIGATDRPVYWADPEIEAAAKLNFDSSRTEALTAIARKPALAPQSQVLLVEKVYSRLTFESSKTQVLSALIQNPDFSNAGKAWVVNGLHRLTFDSSRQELISLINQRGPLPW